MRTLNAWIKSESVAPSWSICSTCHVVGSTPLLFAWVARWLYTNFMLNTCNLTHSFSNTEQSIELVYLVHSIGESIANLKSLNRRQKLDFIQDTLAQDSVKKTWKGPGYHRHSAHFASSLLFRVLQMVKICFKTVGTLSKFNMKGKWKKVAHIERNKWQKLRAIEIFSLPNVALGVSKLAKLRI